MSFSFILSAIIKIRIARNHGIKKSFPAFASDAQIQGEVATSPNLEYHSSHNSQAV